MNLPLSLNATSREEKKKDPHTYNGDFFRAAETMLKNLYNI